MSHIPAAALSNATADFVSKKTLTLAAAKKMAAAAEAEAAANSWKVVIAIVDDAGHVIMTVRMDGAPLISVQVAEGKARTAAYLRMPTKTWQEMLPSRPALATIPGILPLQGGLPIQTENATIGGIGVSGAASDQDEQVARAGLTAVSL